MIACFIFGWDIDRSPIIRCNFFSDLSKRYCINEDADLPAPIIKMILMFVKI
jgi:hypothetical protein